jgi:hypothetical protein
MLVLERGPYLLPVFFFVVVSLSFTTEAAADGSSASPAAPASSKRACIDASERAQRARKTGELRAAADALLVCSAPACPTMIREDCSSWMSDVRAAMPTVVFGARDAEGHDVVDVRVFVDGERTAETLDGKPVTLDPGPHAFRFERNGVRTTTEQAVIREGEKNRAITVTFRPAARSEPVAVAASSASSNGGRIPTATWTFGAVSVLAFGGALAVDLSAFGDATCKPHCSDAQVSSIKTKTYAAGALAGVGVLSLTLAAYVFFTRPTSSSAALSVLPGLELRASAHGGGAELRGAF